MRRALPLLLALAACAPSRAARTAPLVYAPPGPSTVAVAPGLSFTESECRLEGASVRLRALRREPGSAVQMRALRNATARTEPSCPGRYGGVGLPEVLPHGQGFRWLGALNGHFFHRLGGGFRSNGMLWSAGELLAPVQPTVNLDFRGDTLVVVDAAGAHALPFSTGSCEPGACRSALAGAPEPLAEGALVEALRARFPGATMALQAVRALEPSPAGGLAPSAFVRCVPEHRWTCEPHSVSLLCAHPGGAVSLLAAENAPYEPLARALAAGSCGAPCEQLYLLDGGGSSQLGYVDPSAGRFVLRFAGRYDPSPRAGCAAVRPVEHYLGFGVAEDSSR